MGGDPAGGCAGARSSGGSGDGDRWTDWKAELPGPVGLTVGLMTPGGWPEALGGDGFTATEL